MYSRTFARSPTFALGHLRPPPEITVAECGHLPLAYLTLTVTIIILFTVRLNLLLLLLLLLLGAYYYTEINLPCISQLVTNRRNSNSHIITLTPILSL